MKTKTLKLGTKVICHDYRDAVGFIAKGSCFHKNKRLTKDAVGDYWAKRESDGYLLCIGTGVGFTVVEEKEETK